MGKPSSTKMSKKSEECVDLNRSKSKMNIPMNVPKLITKKKKNRSKTRKNIKTVFEQLRRQSATCQDSSSNSSIALSESGLLSIQSNISEAVDHPTTDVPQNSSSNNSVILLENCNNLSMSSKPGSRRRRNLPIATSEQKRRKTLDCMILTNNINVINNSLSSAPKTPKKWSHINCSTPIVHKDQVSIENSIINNFPTSNNNRNSVQNFNDDVINLTKEINRDSFLTIDLTADSDLNKTKTQNTVIDLVSVCDTPDCTLVPADNSSMSGDSDVTVLMKPTTSTESQIRNFANGISQLNASAKGKLLELITEKILGGCNVPTNVRNNLANLKRSKSRATETAEDTYIKEIILGEAPSRNSVGSNIYRPERDSNKKSGLRMVVIDGSNVAMEHGKGKMFSVKGLKICIDYFVKKGHVVKAFVPRFRCKFGKSSDPRLLDHLERQGLVVYTPSREIQGKTITPYDDRYNHVLTISDRYIIQCAAEFDGVIVSGDNYRDLIHENPKWRFVIENRLLMFTWVDDLIMFPNDPLGRTGPTLKQFLSYPDQRVINNLFVNF